jgi:hypothetical protein
MKLTFEEHELIGRALKLINHKVRIDDYTFKNKVEMRKSPQLKICELIIKLKSEMENLMYQDYPNQATTDIYYGKI